MFTRASAWFLLFHLSKNMRNSRRRVVDDSCDQTLSSPFWLTSRDAAHSAYHVQSQ
jgi:hypothetical protein